MKIYVKSKMMAARWNTMLKSGRKQKKAKDKSVNYIRRAQSEGRLEYRYFVAIDDCSKSNLTSGCAENCTYNPKHKKKSSSAEIFSFRLQNKRKANYLKWSLWHIDKNQSVACFMKRQRSNRAYCCHIKLLKIIPKNTFFGLEASYAKFY